MAIIQGKNLNLYYNIGGVNYPVCHSTDCKITITGDIQETTTYLSGKGKTFDYQGKYTWTLSLNGIVTLTDTANVSVMQDAILQSVKLLFIFTDIDNIEWSGVVLITQNSLDSPVSNVSTFTNEMQGDGELTKVTFVIPPVNPGYAVQIIDQLGNVIATVPAPGTYSVLRFDTIDEGDAFTVDSDYLIEIIPAA